MAAQPAILGGKPAITLDHSYYTQWPIYTEGRGRRSFGPHSQPRPRQPNSVGRGQLRTWSSRWRIHGASSTPWPIRRARPRCARRSSASVWGRATRSLRNRQSIPSTACRLFGSGAVPIFADIDPVTLTLDPADIERKITPRTKAIMVVHWSGAPADMDAIMDIASRHSLRVVEDNAISQGTTHRGRMAGAIGDAGAISFQHGKTTSAGEGGVFMTNDTAVYQRAASLGHYERLRNLPDPKWRAVSGFSFGEKYRMATLTAAIGVVQMKYWKERLAVRHANTDKLGEKITAIEGFAAPDFPDYFPSPYQSGRIMFDPDKLGGISRERLLEVLQAEGAQVSSPAQKDTHTPHAGRLTHMLHKHPVFAGNEHGTGDILWEVLGPNVTRVGLQERHSTRH